MLSIFDPGIRPVKRKNTTNFYKYTSRKHLSSLGVATARIQGKKACILCMRIYENINVYIYIHGFKGVATELAYTSPYIHSYGINVYRLDGKPRILPRRPAARRSSATVPRRLLYVYVYLETL